MFIRGVKDTSAEGRQIKGKLGRASKEAASQEKGRPLCQIGGRRVKGQTKSRLEKVLANGNASLPRVAARSSGDGDSSSIL